MSKTNGLILISTFLAAFAVFPGFAQNEYFVSADSGNDAWAGTSWDTAKQTIQAAINMTEVVAGDIIFVTNGVYDTGVSSWGGNNRVLINKGITVKSVNGPAHTVIQGESGVRCVGISHANGRLAGFTLTGTDISPNGWHGGGLRGGWASNCVISVNMARDGGGMYQSTVYDSIISGNSSTRWGGGTYEGVVHNSTIANNSAANDGGGINKTEVFGTLISSNYGGYGGGAREGTLYNSILSGNSSIYGAGAQYSTLYSCMISGNSASHTGGGVHGGSHFSCLFYGNQANQTGGGAASATLRSCTIVGNSANSHSGGVSAGTVLNSIVFNNMAPASSNYNQTGTLPAFNYSCAAPLPPSGDGNTDSDPLFVSSGSGFGMSHSGGDYRLNRISPCLNKGLNQDYMTDPDVLATNAWLGRDVEGGPRIRHHTVDMGAFELRVPRGSVFSVD